MIVKGGKVVNDRKKIRIRSNYIFEYVHKMQLIQYYIRLLLFDIAYF